MGTVALNGVPSQLDSASRRAGAAVPAGKCTPFQ
jgi:hypothetical protein